MSANKIKEPLMRYTSKVRLWEFLENQQRSSFYFKQFVKTIITEYLSQRRFFFGPSKYKAYNTVTIVKNDNSVLILITTCKLN